MTRLHGLALDTRHAIRVLWNSRGFFAAAVVIIGLGLGANAAVFRLVDAVILRPLPVANPEQLAVVQLADTARWNGRRTSGFPVLSNPLWERFRDTQTTFAGVLAWANAELRLGGDAGRRPVRALFVSGDFFRVLGVRPALGRVFSAADDRPGCGVPGAVISDGFWRREMGADATAIGRTITLNERPLEVLGVTPPHFVGLQVGRSYDVAVPVCAQAVLGQEAGWLTNGDLWWLTVMARTRPGQTLDAVNADLDVRSRELFETTVPADAAASEAGDYRSLRLRAEAAPAGVSALRDQFGDPLLLLLLITALVALLLCANLASLILSRVVTRRPEFALRLAMGASRGDIMRAIVIENALIATAGAAVGLVLSGVLSRMLLTFLGPDVAVDTGTDGRTVAFVVLSAAAACAVVGGVPAWRSAGSAAAISLISGARGSGSANAGARVRQGLVMVQVAISLVLLAGAFLFGQTLRNLLSVESGFTSEGVTIARVDLARLALDPAAQRVVRRTALEAVRQLPGVAAAAEVRHVPLSGTGTGAAVRLDAAESAPTPVRVNGVSDGYFTAMGITLTAGRDFTANDSATSPAVAIVNDAFVRRLGIEGNPVGQRFRVVNAGDGLVEIVGVAANTKHFSLREEFLPIAFVPMVQIPDPRPFTDFVIRGASAIAAAEDVRRAVRAVGPGVDVDVREFAATVQQGLVRERIVAVLSAFFGALAVVIAVVGLYGAILELVARRRAEIGLRMALGATRGAILALVVRSAAIAVGIGLALGTLFVGAAAEPVRALVFGVEALDMAVLGSACAVLAATAAAATLGPAYRAASTPPLIALRDA